MLPTLFATWRLGNLLASFDKSGLLGSVGKQEKNNVGVYHVKTTIDWQHISPSWTSWFDQWILISCIVRKWRSNMTIAFIKIHN